MKTTTENSAVKRMTPAELLLAKNYVTRQVPTEAWPGGAMALLQLLFGEIDEQAATIRELSSPTALAWINQRDAAAQERDGAWLLLKIAQDVIAKWRPIMERISWNHLGPETVKEATDALEQYGRGPLGALGRNAQHTAHKLSPPEGMAAALRSFHAGEKSK